ncbi:MAG: hypothetical protein RMJ98_08300 [Myxococcales bacterium]|nr:hypothetical protein [Polyangiaceae bacterium]MDW8249287.1 hypothetical protein [Myxococcales bacterium]
MTGGIGLSAQFLTGEAARSLQQARENTSEGSAVAGSTPEEYRRGALAVAALAPGVAPWVSARVGLGHESEGGVAYSGRALRVDGRYALRSGSGALSLGVGGQALLARREESGWEGLRGVELGGVSGYGLDVPLVFGWRSEAGLLTAWVGLRGGYERQWGQIGLDPDGSGRQLVNWSASRWWWGGLVGLRSGFRRVFVVMELDVASSSARASVEDAPVMLEGVTWTPSVALVGRFLSRKREGGGGSAGIEELLPFG